MRIAMKAGKYWLGDPTYLIKEEDMWNAYMDRRSGNDGEVILFGEKCVIFSTMHGDGIFVSNQGHSVPVDSGTIALFPVSLIGECMTGEWMDNVMVTFDEDFECYAENGMLHFGSIVIDTDDEDESCPNCGESHCDWYCDVDDDDGDNVDDDD